MPREERREQLLDVTLELVTTKGFTGLSMEAVAREAEIAKTVVYDLFSDKKELLNALFEREQERVLALVAEAVPKLPLEGSPGEILEKSITTALESVRSHPGTWRLILLPADGTPPFVRDTVNEHRDLLLQQIEPMIAWGIAELGIRELDSELAAHAIVAVAEDAARLTINFPDQYPPPRLTKFVADLISALTQTK